MKTMVNIKLDKELKEEASKLAEKMGFNLSSIISATLRNFVMNREISISMKPTMSPYLEGIIELVREESSRDRSPIFNNAKDAIAWLDKNSR